MSVRNKIILGILVLMTGQVFSQQFYFPNQALLGSASVSSVRDSSGWYRFGNYTKLTNSTSTVAKNFLIDMSGTQPVMNWYASDGDVTSFTVGTSDQMIWSGASGGYSYSNGGIFLGSATGGNKGAGTINGTALYDDNVQLVAPPFDSSHVTNGSITSSDIKDDNILTADLAAQAVTYAKLANALKFFQFALDSASAMAGDTTWVWQNMTGGSVTIDSIHVAASSDDYAISLVECDWNGKNGTLVDAVTAATNGTNLYWQSETTITAATIESGHRVGFKRPASTGDRVYVRVHYH